MIYSRHPTACQAPREDKGVQLSGERAAWTHPTCTREAEQGKKAQVFFLEACTSV